MWFYYGTLSSQIQILTEFERRICERRLLVWMRVIPFTDCTKLEGIVKTLPLDSRRHQRAALYG